MSDPNLHTQRQILALQESLEALRKADVPALALPYAQRAVNPIAATAVAGDFGQPWPAAFLIFTATVFVTTTNNGTNFWTITVQDTTGTILATLSTSAISANTWTRLSTTSVTTPATTNAECAVIVTTTLAPGTLYIVPALYVVRQA